MSSRDVWGWAPHHEGGPWHVYRGDGTSWCGLMSMGLDRPISEPHGRRCRNCLAALERGTPHRRNPRTTPTSRRGSGSHVTDRPCACPECRDRRGEHARDHLAAVLSTRPGCACVHRWPRANRYVGEATDRWAAALFAWELTGDPVTARDVEEATRTLHRAWNTAAEAYEVLDGSHPYKQEEVDR